MKIALSDENQKILRNVNVLKHNEIAYQEGDLFVAEDVLSGSRRILTNAGQLLSESTKKQILFG